MIYLYVSNELEVAEVSDHGCGPESMPEELWVGKGERWVGGKDYGTPPVLHHLVTSQVWRDVCGQIDRAESQGKLSRGLAKAVDGLAKKFTERYAAFVDAVCRAGCDEYFRVVDADAAAKRHPKGIVERLEKGMDRAIEENERLRRKAKIDASVVAAAVDAEEEDDGGGDNTPALGSVAESRSASKHVWSAVAGRFIEMQANVKAVRGV